MDVLPIINNGGHFACIAALVCIAIDVTAVQFRRASLVILSHLSDLVFAGCLSCLCLVVILTMPANSSAANYAINVALLCPISLLAVLLVARGIISLKYPHAARVRKLSQQELVLYYILGCTSWLLLIGGLGMFTFAPEINNGLLLASIGSLISFVGTLSTAEALHRRAR